MVKSIETVEAKQPKAKEPVDFWTKTLRALEKNAAECEKRQQTLRTTKSHPDFLSLGGCPSPPALPSSPTDQSYSAQRRKSRGIAANGRKASQARSLSRGRPTGVSKGAATTINPCATQRKLSASPVKVMTPSRYRAGFRDVWADRANASTKKYELRLASVGLPTSPPPSARMPHDDFAAFGSPIAYQPLPAYDEQLSPLATTFQQAHIHTPIESPSLHNRLAHASNSYFHDGLPGQPAQYAQQTVPLNDTAPLYPDRTASLATSKIQAFDFGFSSSPDLDTWSAATFAEPSSSNYVTDPYLPQDAFGDHVLPSTEFTGAGAGLGISCDPSLVSNFTTSMDPATLLGSVHQPAMNPYYVHPSTRTVPTTPHRRSESYLPSQSPSPPPASEPKSRRSSRRTSRHRRTKSTNSTPRQSQNLDKSGFVNFTPHDSNKILSGVAPSGSSKTKARREKEPADKRRRLSQAAVRAIVEAGGDLDALRRDGLLV